MRLFEFAKCPARSVFRVLPLLLLVLGCASNQKEADSALGSSEDVDQSKQAEQGHERMAQSAPEDAVEKAARPFRGYRAHDQAELSDEELFTYLAAADAICIGERHDQVLDHYAQLRTLRAFAERREMRGFELGMALEMIQSESQYALSEYLAGRSSREKFEEESKWQKTWGFPLQYYDPQLRFAAQNGVHVLALGVSKSLTHRVANGGFGSLSDSDRRQVPSLDLDNAEHRQLFDSLMGGHPLPTDAQLDHYYQAQVLWDEAMAKRSGNWVLEHHPLRKLLIFAGVAHCHKSAIPARMERESELTVANLIVSLNAPNQDSEDLLFRGYEYQIVFE